MPSERATIEVDGHALALTNLRKVLYPETGTTKADVIGYFAEVAHAMIPHVAGRPVTRKRWPEGVHVAPFFHKDLGKGVPSWVTRKVIEHSDGPKYYPVVDSPATLAWLGQIAALELHVPQWRFDAHDGIGNPDRLVFDLDPGPGVELSDCAEVARAVKARLGDGVLVPVTSGSKGMHLYARLDGSQTSDEASAWAKEIAEAIEADMPKLVTSRMARALRPGKVFIDWSQNNASKTTIAPYSLRGRERPTVAAPRTWDELDDPDLRHLDYREVLRLLADAPDPMQGLESGDLSSAEHRRSRPSRSSRSSRSSRPSGASRPSRPSPASPAAAGGGTVDRDGRKLDTYRAKRSAAKTPEPVPEPGPLPTGDDDTFVIQEHHARRLHYDVRLERDGVLVSWAVPRGLPTTPAQNRLAVQTEDHPMEYATFSGTIPRGEYGGGSMTIWDAGTYRTEKWRDGEVIVVLEGERARGRFALIRTQESQWLMHRMKDQSGAPRPVMLTDGATGDDGPPAADPAANRPEATRPVQVSRPGTYGPMLATGGTVADLGGSAPWVFEGKWDGIRAIATVGGDAGLSLMSRAGNDITKGYPELAELADSLRGLGAVLDGEIVALDTKGRSSFGLLQQRMNLVHLRDITRMTSQVPVQYWLFDVLELNGVSLVGKKLDDRRRLLEALPIGGPVCHVPDRMPGPAEAALARSRELFWEGIVAKRADSPYLPGKRVRSWLKIKNFRDTEVVVVGWRPGAGRREGSLGALLVAVPDERGRLRYAGRVGTGFTDAVLDQLMATLAPLRTPTSAVADSVPRLDARDATWVRPELVGEVRYGEWTTEGRFRAPSWRGLRPDKTVDEVGAPEVS